jgi:hypothetical protein
MTRIALAGSFVLMLGTGIAATADPACNGLVAVGVEETVLGLSPVRQVCYEHGPNAPYFFDAPIPAGRVEVEEPSSITVFEASTIQAMGAVDISELTNPIPSELRPQEQPSP